MQLSMEMHQDGSWWVNYGTNWTGPFPNKLAASTAICQIVSDRGQAIHGNNVYFLEGRFV
jgi:hypothetical protein